MEAQEERASAALERVLHDQRTQLLRWCAYLTGNADVAEDLVQETLAAAWRSTRQPAFAADYPAWLAGIARNICRSWQRGRRRDLVYNARPFGSSDDESAVELDPADPFDVEEALERDELAYLLDRALALLPAETRLALIAKYIEQSSLEEVAARLKISQGALAARLHRGKLALRQVLVTNLCAEAASYGLVPPAKDAWQQTRIWCPACGARMLLGRLASETGHFALRCPGCYEHGHVDLASWQENGLFQGLASYRVALSRLSRSAHAFYRSGLRQGSAPCVRCGQRASTVRVLSRESAASEGSEADGAYLRVYCAGCSATYTAGLSGLVLCHPTVQRFWRAYPRMSTLPDREIESDGRPAILTSFVSRDGGARLDVISDRETFAVRRIGDSVIDE